jgi:hypothetical protein
VRAAAASYWLRWGRGTSSPRQFGHTWLICSPQGTQNVHS